MADVFVPPKQITARIGSEVGYTHIPKKGRSGTTSSGYGATPGEFRLGLDGLILDATGECTVHGPQSNPLPMNSDFPQRRDSTLTCGAYEAFVEVSLGDARVSLGKRNLEFSQGLLSSPANPSRAGLIQGSPFDKREGILNFHGKVLLGSLASLHAGLAVPEPEGKFLFSARDVRPFASFKLNFEVLDATLTGANRFVGVSTVAPVGDSLLLYAEGNTHAPLRSATGELNPPQSQDALFGFSLTHATSGATFVMEALRNGPGLPGKATPVRYAQALQKMQSPRSDTYDFVTPRGRTKPTYGASAFLSRNLLFVSAFQAPEELGPLGRFVVSLDDGSTLGILAYNVRNRFRRLGSRWIVGVSWTSLRGRAFSEFGEAGAYTGRNIFSFTVKHE